MIRIRDIEGNEIALPKDGTFVEICAEDGKVAFVFFNQDTNTVCSFDNESPEADRYASRFNIEFTDKVIDLSERYKDI